MCVGFIIYCSAEQEATEKNCSGPRWWSTSFPSPLVHRTDWRLLLLLLYFSGAASCHLSTYFYNVASAFGIYPFASQPDFHQYLSFIFYSKKLLVKYFSSVPRLLFVKKKIGAFFDHQCDMYYFPINKSSYRNKIQNP